MKVLTRNLPGKTGRYDHNRHGRGSKLAKTEGFGGAATVDYLKVAACPAFFVNTLWTAITNIMIGSTE